MPQDFAVFTVPSAPCAERGLKPTGERRRERPSSALPSFFAHLIRSGEVHVRAPAWIPEYPRVLQP